MFTFNLMVILLLTAYVSGPLFAFHLLWLVASAWWTETPLAILLQDIVVIRDDILLPHPPGSFNPFDSAINNDHESTLDSPCCTLPTNGLTLSGTLDSGDVLAAQGISSDCEYSTTLGDILTLADLGLAMRPIADESSREKACPPLRRSLNDQVISRFGRRASPGGRAHETPVPLPKSPASTTFRRISTVWSRKKEVLKKQDDPVALHTKFRTKLTSIKNTKFF